MNKLKNISIDNYINYLFVLYAFLLPISRGGRTGRLAFAVSIFVVGFLNIKNKFLAFFSILALVVSIFYTAYHVSPIFKTMIIFVNVFSISSLVEKTFHEQFSMALLALFTGIIIAQRG